MQIPACSRPALPALLCAVLSACVYAPVPQQSYSFERHPGVFLEVGWQYDAYGYGRSVSTLVNRSGTDKCAWTDQFDSRLLRAGEAWQVAQVQSPGNVGVSNVQGTDPNCVNAKRNFH